MLEEAKEFLDAFYENEGLAGSEQHMDRWKKASIFFLILPPRIHCQSTLRFK